MPGLGLLSAEPAGSRWDRTPGKGMLSGSGGIWRMETEELGTPCLAGKHHPHSAAPLQLLSLEGGTSSIQQAPAAPSSDGERVRAAAGLPLGTG